MAGKSLGTLTLDVVADTGNLQVGLRKAGETMTAFQKRLNTITTGQDSAYQGAMSRMSNYYAKLEKTSEKAVNKLVAHSNTLAGIENQRKIALENLNKVFHESERSSDAYRVALEGIESSYAMGVNRVNAYNKALGMTGDKSRFARHEMLNLSYQLNDVFVGFMSGQRPMTIFAQQGAQIGQIAVSAGLGVKGLAVALASMAKSAALAAGAFLLNPYVLSFTAVLGGAVYAIKQFNDSIDDTRNIDEFAKSIGLTREQVKAFKEELDDLGGSSAGFLDTIGAFFELGKTDSGNWYIPLDQLIKDFDGALAKMGKSVEDKLDIRQAEALVKILEDDYFRALDHIISQEEKLNREYKNRVDVIRAYANASNKAALSLGKDILFTEEAIQKLIQAQDKFFDDKKWEEWKKGTEGIRTAYKRVQESGLTALERLRKEHEENKKAIYGANIIGEISVQQLNIDLLKEEARYREEINKYKESEEKRNKAANKDIERRSDIMKKLNAELDNEIARMGMLSGELAIQQSIDKANERLIKVGTLTSSEEQSMRTRLSLLQDLKKVQVEYEGIYSRMSENPDKALSAGLTALAKAQKDLGLSTEQYRTEYNRLMDTWEAATDPLYQINKELAEQQRLFGLFGDDRTVAARLTPDVTAGMTSAQQAEGEKAIRTSEEMARMQSKLDGLWTENAGAVRNYTESIKALNEAESQGIITSTQHGVAVKDLNIQMLQLQALRGDFDNPFEAWSSGLAMYASDYKGVMAELQTIGANFTSSFANGMSDAFAKSIMAGDSFKDSMYDLAQNALQMVISQLIQMAIQAMIVRAIMGFGIAGFGSAGANSITGAVGAGFGPGLATGGYTGNLPRDKAVNYVHGQEFVVNANATARNRALLESINAGKPVTADMVNTRESAKVNVNIQNYGTDKAFEVQQLSAEEIRIIARDEVKTQTPKIFSQQMSRPNSEIFSAISRNTDIRPRR
jgi:hypothetical protein